MDPKEIFELIIKADEKLKYATSAKGDVRAAQAQALLEEARDAARAVDNDGLVAQAETRLADLEALSEGGPAD
ncbi:MAG: hypothetical protein ACRDH7_11920 [Actinomycetota bacterium]